MGLDEATATGDEVGRAVGVLLAAGMADVSLDVNPETDAVAISVDGFRYSTVVPVGELVAVIEDWLRARTSGDPYSVPGRRLEGAPCT